MALSKRQFNVVFERIIFAYLVVFPLGQLLRIVIPLSGMSVRVHVADLVCLLGAFIYLISKNKRPKVLGNIFDFLLVAGFSLILSVSLFPIFGIFIGLMYFLRFVSYALFFAAVYAYCRGNAGKKQTLLNSLIIVSIASAILGWTQYLFLSDIRFLKILNWDDHLYRLAGTFLDPGFMGIILVLGSLASLVGFLKAKKKVLLVAFVFLAASLAFTYSRASYLAFFAGIVPIVYKKNIIKKAIFVIAVFLTVLLFLPRPGGEGVRLERLNSVFARFRNYSETVEITKISPVLGIGFNNMCAARLTFFEGTVFDSHACSGSDSSLLLVFATTGIVGLMVFLYMGVKILTSVETNIYGLSFYSASAALFVHGLFVNSLFYPWVMGWMAILLGISLKEIKG